MELPADLLRLSPPEAVRLLVLARLDEARQAASRLGDPDDAEALHDFRVGIRRTRSTLGAWRKQLRGRLRKRHRKALRATQRATGGGRDAEVAVAWIESEMSDVDARGAGVERALSVLRGRYGHATAAAREDVLAAFAELESELRTCLAQPPAAVREGAPSFASAYADLITSHADALAKRLGTVRSVSDRVAAHAARIRCKHLRYLVEPLKGHIPRVAGLVRQCKRVQDVLGDMNDAHVQIDLLEELAQEAAAENGGIDGLAARAGARRERLFETLRTEWLESGLASLLARAHRVAALVRSEAP